MTASKAATEGATPPAASVLAPGVGAVVLAAAGAPACASRRAATASRRATRDSMFTAMTTFLGKIWEPGLKI